MVNIVRKAGRPGGWTLFDDDFDNLFGNFLRPSSESEGGGLVPAIDVHENDHSYTVRAEMPGVKKDDIDVTVQDGILTINAESKYEHEEKEKGRVIRQERRYGKYVRSIRLGRDIDSDKVKANYKDGVLELVLPKVEEVQPKKISVDID